MMCMPLAGAHTWPPTECVPRPSQPTWKVVSTTGPGRVKRRHCGITRKLPPPSSTAFGMHEQLSRLVGRQRPGAAYREIARAGCRTATLSVKS